MARKIFKVTIDTGDDEDDDNYINDECLKWEITDILCDYETSRATSWSVVEVTEDNSVC